jgi:hypothetical protein
MRVSDLRPSSRFSIAAKAGPPADLRKRLKISVISAYPQSPSAGMATRPVSMMTRSFARPILALTLCALVAGCITTAEQQAKRNEERCVERGYQPKSDAFNDCIVRLDTERTVRMDQRHREAVEKSAIPSSNRGY